MGFRPYTQDEIDLALMACALENGNVKGGHRRLEAANDDGDRIPSEPLMGRWIKHEYPERYVELKVKVKEYVAESVAEAHMRAADSAMEVEQAYREKALREVDEIEPRDIPGAARNMATIGAIHVDKATILRQQPTSIIQHRSVEEIERELAAHGVEIIEGASEEMPEIMHQAQVKDFNARGTHNKDS